MDLSNELRLSPVFRDQPAAAEPKPYENRSDLAEIQNLKDKFAHKDTENFIQGA